MSTTNEIIISIQEAEQVLKTLEDAISKTRGDPETEWTQLDYDLADAQLTMQRILGYFWDTE